jgi:hypothetical protein
LSSNIDNCVCGSVPNIISSGDYLKGIKCPMCGISVSNIGTESLEDLSVRWNDLVLPEQIKRDKEIDEAENQYHLRYDAEPNTRSGLAFTHHRYGEP